MKNDITAYLSGPAGPVVHPKKSTLLVTNAIMMIVVGEYLAQPQWELAMGYKLKQKPHRAMLVVLATCPYA